MTQGLGLRSEWQSEVLARVCRFVAAPLSFCHSRAKRRIPESFLWPFLRVIQSRCGEESRRGFFCRAAPKKKKTGILRSADSALNDTKKDSGLNDTRKDCGLNDRKR